MRLRNQCAAAPPANNPKPAEPTDTRFRLHHARFRQLVLGAKSTARRAQPRNAQRRKHKRHGVEEKRPLPTEFLAHPPRNAPIVNVAHCVVCVREFAVCNSSLLAIVGSANRWWDEM